MKMWQVQEAKMKLSKLINEAKKYPQLITVRGEGTAVVLSKQEYERLTRHKLSFYQAMQKFPYKEEGLDFERISDNKVRKVNL
jgi:prevent-host-death family protein